MYINGAPVTANSNITQHIVTAHTPEKTVVHIDADDAAFYVDDIVIRTNTFVLTSSGNVELRSTADTMFSIVNPDKTFIGETITFKGNYKDNNTFGIQSSALVMFDFYDRENISGSLECYANFKDTMEFGIDVRGGHQGTSNRVEYAHIRGTYENSGVRLNSGIADATVNVKITDPYQTGLNRVNGQWRKRRGLWTQCMRNLVVNAELHYGHANWFMQGVDKFDAYYETHNRGYDMWGVAAPLKKTDTVTGALAGYKKQGGKIDTLRSKHPSSLTCIDYDSNPAFFGVSLESTPGPTNNVTLYADMPNLVAEGYVVNRQGDVSCTGHTMSGRARIWRVGTGSVLKDATCETVELYEHIDGTDKLIILDNVKADSGRAMCNNHKIQVSLIDTDVSITPSNPTNFELV